MSLSQKPISKLEDLLLVVKGMQKLANLGANITSKCLAEHPLTKNVSESTQGVTNLAAWRQCFRDINENPRSNPVNVLVKSGLVVDNILEFTKASVIMMAKNGTANSLKNSKDEVEIENVLGKIACKKEKSRNGQKTVEYELNPNLSALELLETVDLTNKNSIYQAAFVPKKQMEGEDEEEVLILKQTPDDSFCGPSVNGKKLSTKAHEHAVPASRASRFASFGSLGVGLGLGTLAEASKRVLGISDSTSSSMVLSDANAERIVSTLCRVRGAALKIGQILSIQDEAFVSPQVSKIFERVRESADFMPKWQMEKVMFSELGSNWREDFFEEFDDKPFAAASIGQVHSAVLKNTSQKVAVKVQYPGVGMGIESDVSNLMALLSVAKILPDGLFLDSIVQHLKVELAQECDYVREAECCRRMKSILFNSPNLYVPSVIDELSTNQILTTEMIEGLTIDQCTELDQDTRNHITSTILVLLFRELFIFRYMQTDPNWANFLYNPNTRKIGLLDFGATREYRPFFVNNYFKIIEGSANGDRKAILDFSRKVGFLTGYESQPMNDAHVESVMILGECFREDKLFDFGAQKTTQRMQELVPIMIKTRLCPPPPEVYSLHRKMSGLFLLATKLNAKINCYPLWNRVKSEFRPHNEL